MAVKSTFVIVGAGLAGATAAETLRSQGFDGRIALIGDETARPYERPPLSKDYLRGEKGFEAAAVHEEGYYDANGIELRTSTIAESTDPKTDEVVLSTGEGLSYDRLLLATGAAPRRLAIPGADLPGVHYLRRLEDADQLRQALRGTPRVVVIGSGWIVLEVAASARQLGAEVVLVGRASLQLAEQGGLAVVNGVTVDEHLQASIPGVYAAGDVASAFHPLYGTHIRLEHWSAALNQGPVAAQNMLGQNSVYSRVPYFYSDQYDFGMEYRGWASAWDRVVFRGDPAGREFIAFWMRDGRVIAVMNANVWDASKSPAALVTRRRPVDAAHLADPERPLDDLAPQPAS